MKPLTVLHAVPDLRPQAGGIAAVVGGLADALSAEQVISRFVTISARDSEARGVLALAGERPWQYRRSIDRLIGQVQAMNSGGRIVCHSHGLWHPLNHALAAAAASAGLPVVISVHGMLHSWARAHRKWRKDAAWYLYQRSDLQRAGAVHVTSADEKRQLDGAVALTNVQIIPFGIHVPNVLPTPRAPDAPRNLVFLGRLHPIKNLPVLIAAFARAAPADWRLRLVGPAEDEHDSELRAIIARHDLAARVSIEAPAFGTDKDRLIAEADAVVLPSFSENFGMVVGEALALGRPVIASTGTPWRALSEADCGWWAEPSEAGLDKAIADLTSKPEAELDAMGLRGREMIISEYGWPAIGHRMAELYRTL